MDRRNIEKIAASSEDKLLLAKVWDKINTGISKNILSSSCFLTPRELEMTRYLFGNLEGLYSFGGYADAERQVLIYVPDYLDETTLMDEDSPVACLRAGFYQKDNPSHRDFLGALVGAGIARETIGDICIGNDTCDFFVSSDIAPYLMQTLHAVGRTNIQLTQIPLNQAQIPEPQLQQIRDTLASVRLDSVIRAGFRISRNAAAQYIAAGKVTINGLPCEKPDKSVVAASKIAVRGLGKIKLTQVNGQTKKGRISVVIDRYM